MLKDCLIVGCGDIGVRIARLIQAGGGRVTGLARSEVSAARLRSYGIEPVSGNLDDPSSLTAIPSAARLIFYLAPPPGGGTLDSRMRHFCGALAALPAPAKIVYMSTSGVYGDCAGAWVTEQTPLNPQTSRARRRVDAESILTDWGRQHAVAVVILRVTGIYGPGRLPLARLQQGHPVLREEEAPPTNRIHADDLASVCLAAATRAAAGAIFNVSDGRPGTMTGYFNAIADLLGLPRPPQVSRQEAEKVMTPMMLSYLSETRRMDHRKMIEDLGVSLHYPDLDAGLSQILAQADAPNMGYLGSVGH